MKKIIPFFVIALVSASCSKDSLLINHAEFAGEWEHMRSETVWGSTNSQPAGNGRIIALGENGSFERRSHDTVLFRGNYSLNKKKDCYGDERQVFIKTNDVNFPNNYVISREGDSLMISTSNCFEDGGTSIYRKL